MTKRLSMGALVMVVAVVGSGCLFDLVASHSYHLGSCPSMEPMSDFSMDRMLGRWYVIQKTSTGSKCLTYNFTATGEPGEYKVEQVSEHPVLGLVNVDNKYHYTGVLTTPDKSVPAKMKVRFPLSVAGSASYTVVMTDYDTYATVFSCQSLAFANRQSATLLSRTKTLDKIYVDKMRARLSSNGVDPFELSVIDQSGCPDSNSGVNINIDDGTFSPANIGGAVRKAGEKIGDGVEVAAEGAKKLYNAVSSRTNSNDRREELIQHQNSDPDAEWLP